MTLQCSPANPLVRALRSTNQLPADNRLRINALHITFEQHCIGCLSAGRGRDVSYMLCSLPARLPVDAAGSRHLHRPLRARASANIRSCTEQPLL